MIVEIRIITYLLNSGLLDVPGGFMIGLHCSSDEKLINVVQHIRNLDPLTSICPGTYIVDLSQNVVHQYNGQSVKTLTKSNIESIINSLPYGPRMRMQTGMSKEILSRIQYLYYIHYSNFDN